MVVLLLVAGVFGSVPASAASPSLRWYATGDSFSSGQGVQGNTGACGQTHDAWGPGASRLLTEDGTIKLERLVFTACTGRVVSDHFVRNASGKGSLFEWAKEQGLPPGDRFDLVTMTFGGNDIRFADVLLDCMAWQNPGTAQTFTQLMAMPWDDCDVTEAELNQAVDSLDDPERFVIDDGGPGGTGEKAAGGLRRFYETMLDRLTTPDGHLVVLGYPPLFAPSSQWGLHEGFRCHGVTRGDANMLGRVAQRLDTTITAAAAAADSGRGRIHYLPVLDLFANNGRSHSLCGSAPQWVNGITATPYLDSFHPTLDGHAAQATLTATHLKDNLNVGSWTTAAEPARPLVEPQRLLDEFLTTWWAGRGNSLETFATPEALTQFRESPDGWAKYILHWDESCRLTSDGTGRCSFSLISEHGGGFSFEVKYRPRSPHGQLVIYHFEPLGGGA